MWTIGYGTTQGAKQGMKITQEEAEELLIKECQKFYNGVFAKVGKICNENQIGALISFCYNVGLGAFEKSTLLKVIKSKSINDARMHCINQAKWKLQKKKITKEQYQEIVFVINESVVSQLIQMQFLEWIFAGGKVLRGLENRRKAEVELYFKKP